MKGPRLSRQHPRDRSHADTMFIRPRWSAWQVPRRPSSQGGHDHTPAQPTRHACRPAGASTRASLRHCRIFHSGSVHLRKAIVTSGKNARSTGSVRGNVTLARRERDLHADPVLGTTAVDGSGPWARFWARAEAIASREQRWGIGSHSVRHYRRAARQPRWPVSRISQASATCPPRSKAWNGQSFCLRSCPIRTAPFVGGRASGFII